MSTRNAVAADAAVDKKSASLSPALPGLKAETSPAPGPSSILAAGNLQTPPAEVLEMEDWELAPGRITEVVRGSRPAESIGRVGSMNLSTLSSGSRWVSMLAILPTSETETGVALKGRNSSAGVGVFADRSNGLPELGPGVLHRAGLVEDEGPGANRPTKTVGYREAFALQHGERDVTAEAPRQRAGAGHGGRGATGDDERMAVLERGDLVGMIYKSEVVPRAGAT
ncbi:hypothetical protein V8F20_004024 [Naviculisporaceae sp. PSN 640]